LKYGFAIAFLTEREEFASNQTSKNSSVSLNKKPVGSATGFCCPVPFHSTRIFSSDLPILSVE
jgi:hypothetical protein